MENSTTTEAPSERPPRAAGEGRPPREGRDAIRAAAGGERLSPEEQQDALQWFLRDEPEQAIKTIEVNVGTDNKENAEWIPWTIRAIDDVTLRRIRQQAGSSRRDRRTGDMDEGYANAAIVVAGTEDPDLLAAAQQKGIENPVAAVRNRFAYKPGLVGQIAGEIMSISGFDDEDLRDAAAEVAGAKT